jgi:flagellar protein FliO/FliZ
MSRRVFIRIGPGVAALALGAVLLVPAPARAQALEYSFTSAALKMAGVLALVLGVLLGLVYLLKKISPRFNRGAVAGQEMDLVAQYPLGPKKTLAVVRVGERFLLLGVTEENINLLTEIDDPALMERLTREDKTPIRGFGDILDKVKGRKEGAGQ